MIFTVPNKKDFLVICMCSICKEAKVLRSQKNGDFTYGKEEANKLGWFCTLSNKHICPSCLKHITQVGLIKMSNSIDPQ